MPHVHDLFRVAEREAELKVRRGGVLVRTRFIADVGLAIVRLARFRATAGSERQASNGHNKGSTHRHSCSSGTFQLSSIILMIPEKSLFPPPRSTKRWYSSSASPPIGV